MKLFGFEFGRAKKPERITIPEKEDTSVAPFAVNFSRPEIPFIKETINKEWVLFGENNLYPQYIITQLDTSAIHNAIVVTKSKMVAGSDILFSGQTVYDYIKGLDAKTAAYLKEFYEKPSRDCDDSLNDLLQKISYDWQIHGSCALEIIWSLDFTRIASIKHIDVAKLRSGKKSKETGEVDSWYYSDDWVKFQLGNRHYYPNRIAAFDESNKTDYCQIMYIRNKKPGLEYYGQPEYVAALSWINIDSQMGKFHLSNINNGFSPSIMIKFYQKPSSPEIRDDLVRGILKQHNGTSNAGKALVFFSDGKELAPDIQPVETSGLDQQFLVLGEQVVQQIISAHRVTSPALLGIALPGKLGYSNELASAYSIFDTLVITPDQNIMERILQKIVNINKFDTKVTIKKLNPIEGLALTPADTLSKQTIDEEFDEPTITSEVVRNLSGRQHQTMLRIIRQHSKGTLTRDQAFTLLKAALGLDDDSINSLLGK